MDRSSEAEARHARSVKIAKWLGIALCVLLGPGLLALGGSEVMRRSDEVTETANATVVAIKVRNGSSAKLKCTVVEWDHEGKTRRAELPDCDSGFGAPPVGRKLAIRYAPSEQGGVYPDTWMGMYGMSIPTGIVGTLFTAVLLLLLFRRRKTDQRT